MSKIEEKIKESEKEFEKKFIISHPGDSGMGGNDPQEPVYQLDINPDSFEDIGDLKKFIFQEYTQNLIDGLVEEIEEAKFRFCNRQTKRIKK